MFRVMIADDEPIMRQALQTLTNWEALDCQVVYTAANGQEILDNLENARPDIIVTDIRMPEADGIQIARYVWEHELQAKVIILTAYADFSYAKSALKYNVVDYVTKTGAFDGLTEAVEKAKEQLKRERRQQGIQGGEAETENFLKAVIDGTLYRREDILEKEARLQVGLRDYLVLLFQFCTDRGEDQAKNRKAEGSLLNFLGMLFGDQIRKGFFIGRNTLALLLNGVEEDFQDEIGKKCGQAVDMMDNFMKLDVYIGISTRAGSILELSESCQQARNALGGSFLDNRGKIRFYQKTRNLPQEYYRDLEKMTGNLSREIHKGEVQQALDTLCGLLDCQKAYHCPGDEIKNSGIQILGICRKYLAEFDMDICDLTGWHPGITSRIYGCTHVEEYRGLMEEMVRSVAEFLGGTANRKNSLVSKCEEYIEEHFMSCMSVADVARYVGASPSYLSRIYKEATGHTLIFQLNRKKIEQAKNYLRDTDMKIYEIADALGFENTTYFSYFFKKHTGISPKDYK